MEMLRAKHKPVASVPLQVGSFVRYQGKEYQIVSRGAWGLRIERGYGMNALILVVQPDDLE